MLQFSIIIPVWNAETKLPLCLEALERQTIAKDNYEIIVIDDGSTDRTEEVARQFQIIYHVQGNRGPASARNQGVSLAQGELIFFTDADCVPDSNWLEEMAAPFSRPEVAAVKGAYRTEQESLIARFAQLEFAERYAMLSQQPSIDMISTYSAGFRKTIFQTLGGFDTRFPKADNEDTEFSYRMAEQGYMMIFAPLAVVRHLYHPDSVACYFWLKFGRGYWRLMVYRMFPGKMIKDSYTPQSLKLQIISLFSASASLFLFPFSPQLGVVALTCSILFFLIQTISFTYAALKQDWIVALFAPCLLALRAGAIGSGVLWGLVRIVTRQDIFSMHSEGEK